MVIKVYREYSKQSEKQERIKAMQTDLEDVQSLM